MTADSQQSYRERQWILTIAALMIVIAGLREAGTILLPMLMAVMFAIVSIPPLRWLQRRGVPDWLSLIIVVLVAGLAVLFVTAVVASSINRFTANVDTYSARLNAMMADGLQWLDGLGVEVKTQELAKKLDGGKLFQLIGSTAGGILSILSQTFLVLLILIFILLEANGFSAKLRAALGDEDADLGEWVTATDRVYDYVFLKAIISAATGVLISLLTWAMGVDFPLLWGMIAFMFNFVPNIGSIIAAVPAVLLALVQHGVGVAGGVAVGYIAVNLIIGNVVEPKVMGEKLGLSTLVVFLSLVFWGWLWGPVGMLLSVPLTVIVKIGLEHTEQFKGAAVLLGPNPRPAAPALQVPGGGTDDQLVDGEIRTGDDVDDEPG